MAIFDVSTLADSGPGSLRDAIAQANATAGADTITFQSAVTGTIALTTGQIAITDSVTIDGPGAAALAVSGSDLSRVFYLYNPAVAPIDVTISGLTITDGRSVVEPGGAIRASGENLTLEDAIVQDSAAAADGGGIASTNAALTIRNTIIRRNDAMILTSTSPTLGTGGDGGGVSAEGSTSVTLDTVTLERNDAGWFGGALLIRSPQLGAPVLIVDSTLHDNATGPLLYQMEPRPDHSGGGFSLESVPDFTIRRSTISGNLSNYAGGAGGRILDSHGLIENSTFSSGYANGGPGGSLGITDSTITITHGTFADNFSLHFNQQGLHAVASTVSISNSILANDRFGYGIRDLATEDGATIALRYTYVRSPGTANIQDDGGNIISAPVTPVLFELQDNGGPTRTYLPRGVVLNAGDPAFTPPPSTDQRGQPRVSNGRIDMGSVELRAGTIQFEVTASSVVENTTTFDITLTRTGGDDGAVGVVLSHAGGTASQPSDFNLPSPIIASWTDGDSAPKVITVSIHDDFAYEGNETFILQIDSASNGAVVGAPATHTVTIIDNDAPAEVPAVPALDAKMQFVLAAFIAALAMVILGKR